MEGLRSKSLRLKLGVKFMIVWIQYCELISSRKIKQEVGYNSFSSKYDHLTSRTTGDALLLTKYFNFRWCRSCDKSVFSDYTMSYEDGACPIFSCRRVHLSHFLVTTHFIFLVFNMTFAISIFSFFMCDLYLYFFSIHALMIYVLFKNLFYSIFS